MCVRARTHTHTHNATLLHNVGSDVRNVSHLLNICQITANTAVTRQMDLGLDLKPPQTHYFPHSSGFWERRKNSSNR